MLQKAAISLDIARAPLSVFQACRISRELQRAFRGPAYFAINAASRNPGRCIASLGDDPGWVLHNRRLTSNGNGVPDMEWSAFGNIP
jgi:hypothetical protein